MQGAMIDMQPVIAAVVPILVPRLPAMVAIRPVHDGIAVDFGEGEFGVIPIRADEPNVSPVEVIDISLSNLQDLIIMIVRDRWPPTSQSSDLQLSNVIVGDSTLAIGFGDEIWGVIDLDALNLDLETRATFSLSRPST
jgi:hypothetical protein